MALIFIHSIVTKRGRKREEGMQQGVVDWRSNLHPLQVDCRSTWGTCLDHFTTQWPFKLSSSQIVDISVVTGVLLILELHWHLTWRSVSAMWCYLFVCFVFLCLSVYLFIYLTVVSFKGLNTSQQWTEYTVYFCPLGEPDFVWRCWWCVFFNVYIPFCFYSALGETFSSQWCRIHRQINLCSCGWIQILFCV